MTNTNTNTNQITTLDTLRAMARAHGEAAGYEDYQSRHRDVERGSEAPEWAWPSKGADEAWLNATGYSATCRLIGIPEESWDDVSDAWCEAFIRGYEEAHDDMTDDDKDGNYEITIGMRVEGGETWDDYDTGRVTEIEGEQVTVAWDSGVTTTQHESTLRAEGTRAVFQPDGSEDEREPLVDITGCDV